MEDIRHCEPYFWPGYPFLSYSCRYAPPLGHIPARWGPPLDFYKEAHKQKGIQKGTTQQNHVLPPVIRV